MSKFLSNSIAILCLSIAVSFLVVFPVILDLQLTSLRNDATLQLNYLREESRILINKRADSLESIVTDVVHTSDRRLGSIEQNTFILANSINTNLFKSIDLARADIVSQLGVMNSRWIMVADTLNTNLDQQTTTFNNSVAKLSDTYSSIPSAIATRFDRQTNCDINGLCWQNLATDTLVNFRYTGRDISVAANTFNNGFPTLMNGVNLTVTNFSKFTDNIVRLSTPHWYEKLLGYGLNAGILYSRFNPASNIITVTTQAISSK